MDGESGKSTKGDEVGAADRETGMRLMERSRAVTVQTR